ncbi:MAG: ATP-grasp domain-containing protein [Aggregatilineales bacterium]
MRLQDFQSKHQLQKCGIPTVLGRLAFTPDEVLEIASDLNQPVVIKAQVLSVDRNRSQGVEYAATPEEAKEKASNLFSQKVQGLDVKQVLVEPKIYLKRKVYLGITYDRALGRPVLVASNDRATVDENIPRNAPVDVIRQYIKPILGLRSYQITNIASMLELPRHLWEPFRNLTHGLYTCYTESDALLAELNPLVVTHKDELIALDATLVIDDNALYRQPELALMQEPTDHKFANEEGLNYVKLDGQIGCMVNGTGLAMTTMDMIIQHGNGSIRPANYLDIGDGATADRVAEGLQLILKDADVKSILINIFGGLTRCDEVANGIIKVCSEKVPTQPIVVRLQGTNAPQGLDILRNATIPNLFTARHLPEAVLVAIQKVMVNE